MDYSWWPNRPGHETFPIHGLVDRFIRAVGFKPHPAFNPGATLDEADGPAMGWGGCQNETSPWSGTPKERPALAMCFQGTPAA